MPEGPEIRRAADRIASVLVGQRLIEVQFTLPPLQPLGARFEGASVSAVETRGKALLTHVDNGLTIYSHNQLYGRWYVVKRCRYPATRRSLRLALHTKSHSALLYSASDISVWQQQELAMHPFLARLGPDILSSGLDWQTIAERLRSVEFHRRQVASLYLDQSFLAGVGNYLRSEILFDAGIMPVARPLDLGRKAQNDLARSTLRISQRSYETGGITNPPRRVAALKRKGYNRAAYRHAVFGRANLPCYSCGSLIEKTVLGARRLYWCPACQGSD